MYAIPYDKLDYIAQINYVSKSEWFNLYIKSLELIIILNIW